jgi:hypothetical protein
MKTKLNKSAILKIAQCVALSTFYFAMLAYPFGVTRDGYIIERVLIAMVVFLAISIPGWIINFRKEFFCKTELVKEKVNAVAPAPKPLDISQLAVMNNWLTPDEVKQVVFCQQHDGMSFDKVAVKRNFLTMLQVKSLFEMQEGSKTADVRH